MPAIRLQFVLGTGWSSRLIAWWGQGYKGFSHVDAVLPDGSLLGARSDAAGGQAPGVRVRASNYEDWIRVQRIELACTAGEAEAWESWLRSQEGDGYDKGDILGLIIGRPVLEAGHWICSALQTRAEIRVSKLPIDFPLIDQQVTPNTLLALNYAIGAKNIPAS